MTFHSKKLLLPLGIGLLSANSAFATNGYFGHGYGVKAQGIAGVGTALPQDALAAATNPAGTALIGDRVDVGVTLFVPKRTTDIAGNQFGADGHYIGDDDSKFLIPEIGYTHQLSDKAAYGIAVYGHGGMNTNYGDNPYQAFGGSGHAGVNFEQLFVTPSFAYKLNDEHAIGVSLNFVYQTFEAKGLNAFAAASTDSNNLTDRGKDSTTGAGIKLGWNGKLSDTVNVGLSWASRVHTGGFDKYKGLFVDKGSFDVPENYSAGIAWKLAPALTLAADWQRIRYNQIESVGNPLSNLFAGDLLGSKNGAGFGWRDIDVTKIGASYELSKAFTLRGGYSHADQPIPGSQTFFNILAPGTVQDHLSLGGTWQLDKNEISFFYTRGFGKTVKGKGSIPAAFGGGEANIRLSEDLLGIAYSWKL